MFVDDFGGLFMKAEINTSRFNTKCNYGRGITAEGGEGASVGISVESVSLVFP